MAKVLDSDIIVGELKLQSCYYVHFRTNILGKGIELPFPTSFELKSNNTVFLQG